MSRLFRHSAPKRDSDCPRRREVSSAGRKTNNGEATAGTAIVCWRFKEYIIGSTLQEMFLYYPKPLFCHTKGN